MRCPQSLEYFSPKRHIGRKAWVGRRQGSDVPPGLLPELAIEFSGYRNVLKSKPTDRLDPSDQGASADGVAPSINPLCSFGMECVYP